MVSSVTTSSTLAAYQIAAANYLKFNPNANQSDPSFQAEVMEYADVSGYNMSGLNTSQYVTGGNNILSQQDDGNFVDLNTQTGQSTEIINTSGDYLGHNEVFTPSACNSPNSAYGANMDMSINCANGNAVYTLSNASLEVGYSDQNQTGQKDLINDGDFDLSVTQSNVSSQSGTFVTATTLSLGKDSVNIDPTGAVTLNGSQISIPNGSTFMTSNGSVIFNNNGVYTINTTQYTINVSDEGSYQNLDIQSSDYGIDPTTTGYVGNSFLNGNI